MKLKEIDIDKEVKDELNEERRVNAKNVLKEQLKKIEAAKANLKKERVTYETMLDKELYAFNKSTLNEITTSTNSITGEIIFPFSFFDKTVDPQ